jgi:lysophospholipase L1-like esterase
MNIHVLPALATCLVLTLSAFSADPSPPPAAAPAPLPAFAAGTRILFQGDSITDGNRGRSLDPNHILGHGYVFITAARHGATFPQLKLEFFNRGVSGNTVLDLEKRWQEDALDLKPDLLSVLVGVNDSGRKVPLDQYEQTYDRLLAQARQANPRLKLVLCEPFGLPVGKHKTDWRTWNASLAQQREVVARLAARHDAALVKFQEAFDQAAERAPAEHWIWDAVHPTYSGHQVMADAWEAAVRAKWETAK